MFYGPPVLSWLAIHLRIGLAALSFGWVTTTLFGLLASASQKTGKRASNRWLEMLVAVAPYVFIVGLLAVLAWGINGIVSPDSFASRAPLGASAPFGVNVKVEGDKPSPVEVKISPSSERAPAWREILEATLERIVGSAPGSAVSRRVSRSAALFFSAAETSSAAES